MHQNLYKYFQQKTEIDEQTFSTISPYFKLKKIKKNQTILNIGDVCNFNIFVNFGCLKFSSINDEGKELIRYFAFENKFGTALASFIENKPSSESIVALENSEILVISKLDFLHLIETIPQVNFIYRDILEMAYTTMQKRIYDFQGSNALERLKWLVAYQPLIFSRLSSRVLAAYLGITPYTLSRLKSEI